MKAGVRPNILLRVSAKAENPFCIDLDKLLESLGIGFIKRRAIQNVNITQSIKHYKDEQGVEHIDIKGKSGRGSSRTLDWKEVEQDEPLFGEVLIKSQRLEKVESLTNSLLTEGWSADTFEFGVIHSVLRSDTVKTSKVWSADQVCILFHIYKLVAKADANRSGASRLSMDREDMSGPFVSKLLRRKLWKRFSSLIAVCFCVSHLKLQRY